MKDTNDNYEKEMEEAGFDFKKGTFNLNKLANMNGFHELLGECHYEFRTGRKIQKLIDFVESKLSEERQRVREKIMGLTKMAGGDGDAKSALIFNSAIDQVLALLNQNKE